MWPSKSKYDVFISHAVEDKLQVANELCSRLEDAKLKVWYSGKELKVGDSLEATILDALTRSRYGIVVFSPNYIRKNWAMKEFYFLLARQIKEKDVILPVFYDITIDELRDKGILMDDKWGLHFSKGIDHVSEKLVAVVRNTLQREAALRKKQLKIYSSIFVTLAILLSVLSFSIINIFYPSPSRLFIENNIKHRIDILNDKITKDQSLTFKNARQSDKQTINSVFTDFMTRRSSYRNFYEFSDGIKTIGSKKNVEHELGIDVDNLAPSNDYNFDHPVVRFTADSVKGSLVKGTYWFINDRPMTYEIVEENSLPGQRYEVVVAFHENIRVYAVTLSFPNHDSIKRRNVVLLGFLPREKLVFLKSGDSWVLETD